MVSQQEVTITEAEAKIYDRQIRLWGLEAQKRLRGARILLVGLGGLGAEIAKNLTLAGIKLLTLLDHQPVIENSPNFLAPHDSVGQNVAEASQARAQRLNPMVEVVADKSDVSSLPAEYFSSFDVVCTTRCTLEENFRINEICRKHNIPFYSGDVFGFFGYFFVDLLEHEYAEDINAPVSEKGGSPSKSGKTQPTETKTVKKTLDYVPMEIAFEANPSLGLSNKSWKRVKSSFITMKSLLMFRSQMKRDPETASQQSDVQKLYEIRDHIQHEMKLDAEGVDNDTFNTVFGELIATAAVVGGVLSQEIIKAVSHKDVPIRNYFFFNGSADRSGLVESIGF